MILHIKYLLIPMFLTFFSCKKENADKLKSNEKFDITRTKPVEEESKIFAFYKAFGFCGSNVEYFTDEEARNLYAEKTLSIDVKNGKREDISKEYPQDKIDCIRKNLNLEGKIEIKVIKTNDSFPFDNIKLLNDKYLITSRDGYFFVFTIKQEKIVKGEEKKSILDTKNFESLLNRKIVGLSVINEDATNPYKKYGVDFSTVCYCNSPSMYIDTNLKELIIFNYCDSKSSLKNIVNKSVYKIIKIDLGESKLRILTSSSLEILFQKDNNFPFYEVKTEGDFPTKYVGTDLKTFFTSEPEKFQNTNCEDFEG